MSYLVSLGIFSLDQVTKFCALGYLNTPISVIDNFFNLTLVFNTGSIWGLGQRCTTLLAFLGILAIIFIYWHIRVTSHSRWTIWFAALAGGIAGNTFDRLFRGHVIDFLDFHFKNHHWPCFNIADVAITLTCCWLLLHQKKD